VSVRLKIENSREGLVATISQRDDEGKVIGRPSVSLVGSKEEAKQQAKTLARSLGLKLYGIVDKTAPETKRAPGSSLALAIPFERPKQVSHHAEISQ
jgi:hypothetical protein